MLELHARADELGVLADVQLEPAPDAQHKGIDDGVLRALGGKRNRIQIGVPQTVDVLASWPGGERLLGEAERMHDEFDFYAVRLACSFVPDRGCRFTWARMAAALIVDEGATPPIAFDLFPRDVGDTRTFKRSYGVNPRLKFAFAEVGAEIGGEEEVLRYEPQLTVAGLLTSEPVWTFDSTRRTGLAGSRELFLLTKKPRGTTLRARFALGAEVRTYAGRIPLRRASDDDLLAREYELRP
jgi:hypothetical protein